MEKVFLNFKQKILILIILIILIIKVKKFIKKMDNSYNKIYEFP